MARKKGKRKKLQMCRICKKRQVWRGGDVKNPGPHCKKCYHKHIWPDRPAARKARREAAEHPMPDLLHCPDCGIEADVSGCGFCPNCGCNFMHYVYVTLVQ